MGVNSEMINQLEPWEINTIAQGLSILLKQPIRPDQVIKVMEHMSDEYGGTGLTTIMEYIVNTNNT